MISAVGHETDTTIADYVADLRAPTPSAAAELAVFDYYLVKEQMTSMEGHMRRLLRQKMEAARMRLAHAQTKLRYLSPENKLRENRKYAADLEERATMRMTQLLEQKRYQLALLSGELEGMSPVKKLRQGYSYVSNENGYAVTDASHVEKGDILDIRLLHGTLKTEVIEVLNDNKQ